MTVHGGKTFKQWQLDHARQHDIHRYFRLLQRWEMMEQINLFHILKKALNPMVKTFKDFARAMNPVAETIRTLATQIEVLGGKDVIMTAYSMEDAKFTHECYKALVEQRLDLKNNTYKFSFPSTEA